MKYNLVIVSEYFEEEAKKELTDTRDKIYFIETCYKDDFSLEDIKKLLDEDGDLLFFDYYTHKNIYYTDLYIDDNLLRNSSKEKIIESLTTPDFENLYHTFGRHLTAKQKKSGLLYEFIEFFELPEIKEDDEEIEEEFEKENLKFLILHNSDMG